LSRVVVEDGFAQYGRELDWACRRAIVQGAEATLQIAKGTVPKGATGRLERSIHIGPLIETLTRLRVEVYAGMFYGKFLEFGTLGRRTKRVSDRTWQARRSPSGRARQANWRGEGITPRYFMLKAGRLGGPAFAAALARELGRLGR
jgi:bacteriophage HK97-gp10 putative tail-component